MSNLFVSAVKKYPVTSWAAVGALAYVWKASMVVSAYDRGFAE